MGKHCIKTWSTTQAIIALSSGGAEYYGLVKGSTIGMGMNALLEDMGIKGKTLEVHTDSSASISIAGRTGLGKVRHIDVHTLWAQQQVRKGTMVLWKVLGTQNPADVLTKHLDQSSLGGCMRRAGARFEEGRAASAPSCA